MSNKYIGITVGPIVETLLLTTKPAGLWGASYIFSYFSKTLIENLIESKNVKKEDFIIPLWTDEISKKVNESQVGLLHDRIIFRTNKNTNLSIVEKTINKTKEDVAKVIIRAFDNCNCSREKTDVEEYIKKYIRTHTVCIEGEIENDDNVILKIGKYLSSLELENTFIEKEWMNYILKFLENRSSMESGKSDGTNDILKNSDLTNFKDGWYFENENGIVSIDDISGINNKGDNKNNTDGYFALVQMDGDSLGKILGTLDENKLKDFSKNCFDYADKASAIINEYGGKVIYAGGDDILFLAPLISNNSNQHLFSLIEKISKNFNEIFDYTNVTLSAGIFICYYKYPLCEGLKSVFNLLNKSKEDGKCRTTIQLEQHSKSMGTLQLKTSFEDADIFKLFIKWLNDVNSKNENKDDLLRSIQRKISIYETLFLKALESEKREEKLNILFKNLFEEIENNQKEDNGISVTNIDLKNAISFLVKSYKHKEDNKIKNISKQVLDELNTLISILKFYVREKKQIKAEEGK